jgi:hypothetical protein
MCSVYWGAYKRNGKRTRLDRIILDPEVSEMREGLYVILSGYNQCELGMLGKRRTPEAGKSLDRLAASGIYRLHYLLGGDVNGDLRSLMH